METTILLETNGTAPKPIVAPLNTNTSQLTRLQDLLHQKGISQEHLVQLLSSGALEALIGADKGTHSRDTNGKHTGHASRKHGPDTATITIDCNLTLEQMIAVGKFEWRNPDVDSNDFPVESEGIITCDMRLFHFDAYVSSSEVETRIWNADRNNPWEPACIEHLLAFAAQFPEEQQRHQVVALGSVSAPSYFGQKLVPYLYRRATGRSLHLDWWSSEWLPSCRFLAIREQN